MGIERQHDDEGLPESRTRLAQQRTSLANERTYSAWVRTVLSFLAVALALPRLVSIVEWSMLVRVIGIVFVIFAGILFVLASLRYSEVNELIREEGLATVPRWLFRTMAAVFVLCIVLSMLLLF